MVAGFPFQPRTVQSRPVHCIQHHDFTYKEIHHLTTEWLYNIHPDVHVERGCFVYSRPIANSISLRSELEVSLLIIDLLSMIGRNSPDNFRLFSKIMLWIHVPNARLFRSPSTIPVIIMSRKNKFFRYLTAHSICFVIGAEKL